MKNKCIKCGKEFEAKESYFKLCPSCFSTSQTESNLTSELLLKSYYDSKGDPLKEVYIDLPPKIANIFIKSKPSLGIKQLRDFHRKILKAKTNAMLKGIDSTRFILYECQNDIEYQVKRGVIPESFARFMKHHLALAEKDERSLEGFFKHLDAIVCHFPIKK